MVDPELGNITMKEKSSCFKDGCHRLRCSFKTVNRTLVVLNGVNKSAFRLPRTEEYPGDISPEQEEMG